MLPYNEITSRKYITFEGAPYEVLSFHVFRKQSQKPVNQTRLRNLITGKVIDHSFHASDKVEEASLETQPFVYLFKKPIARTGKMEYWFRKKSDAKDRFTLEEDLVGSATHYIKENEEVSALLYNEDIIGLKIPIKVTLRVDEAPPSVKGNTAQGGTKNVILETGAVVSTPLFVKEGDYIMVNTDTGEYTGKA